MKTVVVFDGTSHFILPQDEYTKDLELIGIYRDIDVAQAKADELNDKNCRG